MILYIIARNMTEYDRTADAVLKHLNEQDDESYGAVVPVHGVADLQIHHRRITYPPHVLLAPRFDDRKDWAELEACLITIQAKVIQYADFQRERNYSEPSCEGTHLHP